MLSPLDILYIVLAFCALWVAAATFWLIFQIAMVVKNFNELLGVVEEKVEHIEGAITSIRHRFDGASGSFNTLIGGIEKVVDYVVEKRRKKGME